MFYAQKMTKVLLSVSMFTLALLACGLQTVPSYKSTANVRESSTFVNQPTGYWADVTGSVNIRACPSEHCDDLGEFTAGDVVYVREVDGRWCQTAWGWSVCEWMKERK